MHVRMRELWVTSLEISKWVGLLVYPLAFELHDQKWEEQPAGWTASE